MGTEPRNLEVKSVSPGIEAMWGTPGVHIGDYNLTMADFCCAMKYVLTNTNLDDGTDPRLEFVEWCRKLQVMEGFSDDSGDPHPDGLRRLAVPEDPHHPFMDS